MKLLTWMHRKIRQNNNEPFKETPQGQTAINSQSLYPKQNHSGVNLVYPPKESYGRKSFASLESTGLDYPDRDSSAQLSESFHGFLAIGTLGAETYISEPETPTFVLSVDKIAERETEVTQNELNLINDELEKVLAAEAKEDGWTDSSRNSYVSNGRSSNTSTFSLGAKAVEAMESSENGKTNCPLQEYLFGSAVELPERKSTARKNRASLGELFQRHKAEESNGMKSERGEKQTHKDKDGDNKTSAKIMRKILRKKIGHFSSTSSAANGEAAEYASETKFHKMLHIFHRKVHPESSTDMQRLHTQNRISLKVGDSGCADADLGFGGEARPDSDDFNQKRYMCHYNNQFYPTKFTLCGNDSVENTELWIKTDADYLVLEL